MDKGNNNNNNKPVENAEEKPCPLSARGKGKFWYIPRHFPSTFPSIQAFESSELFTARNLMRKNSRLGKKFHRCEYKCKQCERMYRISLDLRSPQEGNESNQLWLVELDGDECKHNDQGDGRGLTVLQKQFVNRAIASGRTTPIAILSWWQQHKNEGTDLPPAPDIKQVRNIISYSQSKRKRETTSTEGDA